MNGIGIPRTIWIYWRQGESSLPFLVRTCLESWRVHHPEWEIRLLDHDEVTRLIDMEEFDNRPEIGLQALSDIIRVKLLQRYGGVWVDASLFCVKPMDLWLPGVLTDGFFAFYSHRVDRVMSTWFLAAHPDSELLSHWTEEIMGYWRQGSFRHQGYWSRQILHKLMSLRKRRLISNDFWFSPFMTKKLRIYPYPVNMYLFERMLDRLPEMKLAWYKRTMLFDLLAERLQIILGMNAATTDESRAYIDGDLSPVHKLNWRQDLGYAEKDSNFEYLIRRLERN